MSGERILLVGVASAALGIFVAHASAYFFLLDDFVIFDVVSARRASQLLTQPLFNFYRPGTYLFLRSVFGVFGWAHPSAYIAVSLLLHSGCTALLFALARRIGLGARAASTGVVVFFVSPWATEPTFWASGVFDLLATGGLLTCITLALPEGASIFSLIAAGIGATLAVATKEFGVLAPAIFVVTVIFIRGPKGLTHSRTVAFSFFLVALDVAYLAVRQRLLPGFNSGYGALPELLRTASLLRNAGTYGIGLVWLPFHAFRWLGVLFVAVAMVLAVVAVRTRLRIAALSVLAIGLSIAPVMFLPLNIGTSDGGRKLYLAGAWFCILLASGMERLKGWIRAVALMILFGTALASLVDQSRVWREACRLSQMAIEQFAPYIGSHQPLFVTNLPQNFIEGPIVMEYHAPEAYYTHTIPRVRARQLALTWSHGEAVLAFCYCDDKNPAPRPEERVITLDLPIWMREPRLMGELDAPSEHSDVQQPFTIRGWAIDTNARDGSGIEAVRAYAERVDDNLPDSIFLGNAHSGETRHDVERRLGPRFTASGFSLAVSTLRPGRYRLTIYVKSVFSKRAMRLGSDVVINVIP